MNFAKFFCCQQFSTPLPTYVFVLFSLQQHTTLPYYSDIQRLGLTAHPGYSVLRKISKIVYSKSLFSRLKRSLQKRLHFIFQTKHIIFPLGCLCALYILTSIWVVEDLHFLCFLCLKAENTPKK